MTRFLFVILLLGFNSFYIGAQSVSPSVIASTGGVGNAAGFSISYTIGEALFQTLQTPQQVITQGFQQPEGLAAIKGRLRTPNGDSIPNVSLTLIRGTDTVLSTTGTGGLINLVTVPTSTQTLIPSKNNDVIKSNGVSVLDIVLIQNHILGNSVLNSAYKIIAADVNESNSVSALDLVLIRRLILGMDLTFPGQRLWAFVDSAYQFNDPTNPFPYPDSISFNNLNTVITEKNFYGVKLGDVTYDWNPSVLRTSGVPIHLYFDSLNVSSTKDTIEIPIRVKNFKSISGIQYTLNWDVQKLQLIQIQSESLPFFFNTQKKDQGLVSVIWNDNMGSVATLPDGEVVFWIKYIRMPSAEGRVRFGFSSSPTPSEAYDGEFIPHEVVFGNSYLNLSHKQPIAVQAESFLLYPNPTSGATYINLPSLSPQEAHLSLYTMKGQRVFSKSISLNTGNNFVSIPATIISQLVEGIYQVRIDLGKESIRRSLIIKR